MRNWVESSKRALLSERSWQHGVIWCVFPCQACERTNMGCTFVWAARETPLRARRSSSVWQDHARTTTWSFYQAPIAQSSICTYSKESRELFATSELEGTRICSFSNRFTQHNSDQLLQQTLQPEAPMNLPRVHPRTSPGWHITQLHCHISPTPGWGRSTPKSTGPCLLTQQMQRPSFGSTVEKHAVSTASQGKTNLEWWPEASFAAPGVQGVEFNC